MKNKGFTLIELSIVLVIIGLIVGGVLVGRDLIVAAQVRKTGTLVEQIQTATMTFQNKYNCLPGDCANASSFFTGATNGDGDGNIYGLDGSSNPNSGNENVDFFLHLIAAKLINDTRYCFLNNTSCGSYYAMDYWGLTVPFPVRAGGVIGLICLKPTTWNISTPQPSANHALFFGTESTGGTGILTPLVTFMLDSKFDDGMPMSGRLQTVAFNSTPLTIENGWSSPGTFYPGNGPCNTTGVAGAVYTTDPNYDCPIMWMMPF